MSREWNEQLFSPSNGHGSIFPVFLGPLNKVAQTYLSKFQIIAEIMPIQWLFLFASPWWGKWDGRKNGCTIEVFPFFIIMAVFLSPSPQGREVSFLSMSVLNHAEVLTLFTGEEIEPSDSKKAARFLSSEWVVLFSRFFVFRWNKSNLNLSANSWKLFRPVPELVFVAFTHGQIFDAALINSSEFWLLIEYYWLDSTLIWNRPSNKKSTL